MMTELLLPIISGEDIAERGEDGTISRRGSESNIQSGDCLWWLP